MLRLLQIKNFALAEDLQIEFQPGLNILTGETGTGKSILVGAISAVLGSRVFTEVVRTGFEKATVDAIFDTSQLLQLQPKLEEMGIEFGDGLFLRREISTKGSTRAFINNSPVNITTLAEIGDYLVDIHGQHEHQTLLKQEVHRFFLDSFGKLQPILNKLSALYDELKKIQAQLTGLQEKQKELAEKYDLYNFQINEIDKSDLVAGEDAKLDEERKLLVNSEKLCETSSQILQIFNEGDGNLVELINNANSRLKDLSEFSENLKRLFNEFDSARIVVSEAGRAIEEFQSHLEFDPQRLEEIEGRLNHINQLKKKYSCTTIEEILQRREQIAAEISSHENFEFEIGKLQQSYQKILESYTEVALQLSKERRKAATKMEQIVQQQLDLLGMPKTHFQVRFELVEEINGLILLDGKTYYADQFGMDKIEFYISPNPGEDFKPLSKIASGGEISRIMLALKSILAEIDQIPTLIFDEIDIGVSGRIAQAVGRSIANLSNFHQILCITHLPQIASQGEHHFTVEKFVSENRTFTAVKLLSAEQRIEEIARLMSGEKITETVLESAHQLIKEGRE
jgi:DNA repair protein RecN (Recombination protein N)